MGLCGDEKALGSGVIGLFSNPPHNSPRSCRHTPIQCLMGVGYWKSVKGADRGTGGTERSPDPTHQEALGVARRLPPVEAVITKRHRRDGTDATEMCFSHVGGCKSKVKVPAWLGEGPLPSCRLVSLHG